VGSSKSAGTISVPQGGGAVQGIGEKFAPDRFTGTGNFTVPIAVPSGRGGFQPQLALVYSTGTGNGPFGLGWRLNLPGVSRKTAQGVPRYDDSSDRFVLSGSEDLVPVRGDPGVPVRYLPRTEGLFARIIHVHAAGSDYWEVRGKDGLVSRYGTPRPAHAAAGWRDPAAIADPADQARVFAWQLGVTTDPFGNRIEYRYERDPQAVDGPHRWDQVYLSEIRYVDYGDPLNPRYLVAVRFDYTVRPDPFSDYRAGFEIRTIRRCSQIAVLTNAGAETLTRTYELEYFDEQNPRPALLPPNRVSLLARIRVLGHDGDRSEELPPLDFAWTAFEPKERRFLPLQGSDLPARSLANPGLELVDLFGDGTPDILEMTGTVRYWRNLGDGRFDLPRSMAESPSGLSLGDPGVQLIDANGDGRTDLLVTTPQIAGYFPMSFGGLWDRGSFHRYRDAPSFDLRDPEVRLVDLDGDGVTDAIRSGSRLECFFNDPQQGWTETRAVARRALDQFPNVSFADPRIKWADMNGDSLQDIVQVGDNVVAYWPSLGHGDWAPRVTMANAPRLPFGYDPRRVLLGDLDGDGLADLVYVDDRRVTLWINQGGNGWSDPLTIEGTPPVSDLDAVRVTDLLGAGVAGILWTADATARNRDHLFFLDLTGGIKPYLLTAMDSNMGAETRVGYAASTRFQLEDEKDEATRWRTPLPFPVQVVARVEVVDHLSRSKLSTEYRYHHGYWDGAEREFRGFGLVEQFDSESFDNYHQPASPDAGISFATVAPTHFSPPTLTRTWFHQGPIGDEFGEWAEADISGDLWPGDAQVLTRPPEMTAFLKSLPRRVRRDALRSLRGRILRTELYASDSTPRQDRPYTVSEMLHGVCEVTIDNGRTRLAATASPDSGTIGTTDDASPRIFFPHALAQRTTQWDRGDDPMSQFTFTDYYTDPNPDPARRIYDRYGRLRSEIRIAVPRGRHYLQPLPAGANGEPYLATHVLTDYAERDDGERYIVDRVARVTSYEIVNDGRADLLGFQQAIARNDLDRPEAIFAQTLSFYDGDPAAPDGGAFVGLFFGRVGDYGALTRSETLVLADRIIEDGYRSGDDIAAPPERPPYLTPDAAPAWPAEYSQEFRDRLPPRAGFLYRPGEAGSPYAGGYYAATRRSRYDFHADAAGRGRGLVRSTRDPLGNDTSTDYDPFELLPVRVTDPAGLTTAADYDYRVFQPRLVTGPNGNRTLAGFTPLGLVRLLSVMGKEGDQDGDTDTRPGTFYQYDFLAFLDSPPDRREPASVRVDRRIEHFWAAVHDENARRVRNGEPPLTQTETDALFPPAQADGFPELTAFPDRFLQSRRYSDGFGRMLQTRAQGEDVQVGDAVFGDGVLPARQDEPAVAADVTGRRNADRAAPNVVVSGWQLYDNKGRIVEKYQPYFDTRWEYAEATDRQRGRRALMFYDPRGQLIRTVNPDGSEQRVVNGIPADVETPDDFAPTPWLTYRYDANDNAGRTHPALTGSYRHHWNTPASAEVDALGRTVTLVERNRAAPAAGAPLPPIEEYVTRSTYDILGNLVEVRDALGRRALSCVYDLANNRLRAESIDAGVTRTLRDAAGNVIEQRDGKGALILSAYDALNRTARVWARDDAGGTLALRERWEYGDGGDPNQPAADRSASRLANRLGKTFRRYDEAGSQGFESYDFKGNGLEKARQVISDAVIAAVFAPEPPNWQVPAFRVDWQPSPGTTLAEHAGHLLDAAIYRTSLTYDALNRISMLRFPGDVNGARSTLTPRYNRAGAMESVTLDGAAFVSRIAYDPTGQRVLIAYGNSIVTRYAHDPDTRRLARLRSERCDLADPLTYRPVGAPLQDFAYEHDLAGNLLALHDRTPDSGVPNTPVGVDALDRLFAYDALYRLLSATGRECDTPPPPAPWDDSFRCRDINLTRAYTESYTYDRVGNLARFGHQAEAGASVRLLALADGSNRLATMTVGANVLAYRYDACGNLVGEGTSRHFEWDHSNRLKVYRTQTPAAGALPGDPRLAEPSVYAHYLYDATGQRVKKLVRRQGGQFETTVYIDGTFEYVRLADGRANNLLHVMDERRRIATVRVGAAFPGDNTPAVKYHLGDHLGSSNVVIDGAGGTVDREEFTPYGETSFGSFARKRYRYTGKERDEESDLYYCEARYYGAWLGRWTSCDPAAAKVGSSLYLYVSNNPLRLIDPTGRADQEPPETGGAPETVTPQVDQASGPQKTSIQERRAAGKAREYLWNKAFGEISDPIPGVERVVTQSTWKDPNTLKTVKLNAGPGEPAKSRLPDIAIQWANGAGTTLEITSARNLVDKLSGPQLARDVSGTAAPDIVGTPKQGYVSNIKENLVAGGLPIVGDQYGQGGNIPRAPVEATGEGVGPEPIPESPGTAGFATVGVTLGIFGGVLFAYALYSTYKALDAAAARSVAQGSATPLVKESTRQGAIWTGAVLGGEVAGFLVGAFLGIESGPGLFLTGLAGSAAGGKIAQEQVDWAISTVENAPTAIGAFSLAIRRTRPF
jgi:RHS repeat-associated protein